MLPRTLAMCDILYFIMSGYSVVTELREFYSALIFDFSEAVDDLYFGVNCNGIPF